MSVCQKEHCICIIAHRPNKNWLNFLQQQKQYDIVLIVDDNTVDYKEMHKEFFPDINIVQIDDEKCAQAGFLHLNYVIRKTISGWDKAAYYFSCVNRDYDHVWFIEDDVFFHGEETLMKIDDGYPSQDLLSATCSSRKKTRSWFHWDKIDIDLNPPHYKSMVCAIRVSKPLLKIIETYASNRGRLFFLEAFFPTIAQHNNLICETPKELETIVFRRDWVMGEVNTVQLFHPVKDMNLHTLYRERLEEECAQ